MGGALGKLTPKLMAKIGMIKQALVDSKLKFKQQQKQYAASAQAAEAQVGKLAKAFKFEEAQLAHAKASFNQFKSKSAVAASKSNAMYTSQQSSLRTKLAASQKAAQAAQENVKAVKKK